MQEAHTNRPKSVKNEEHFSEFDEQVLHKTLEDFYTDAESEKKSSIWNFPTFAGLGLLFLSLFFVFQSGLNSFLGIDLNLIDPGIFQPLSLIGGAAATITGLGWFRRRKRKKAIEAKRSKTYSFSENRGESFASYSSNRSENAKSASDSAFSSDFSSSSSKERTNKAFSFRRSEFETEPYALSRNNRLFRSRKDKVLNGVLGGLAKYAGVSPALLRLIFVFGFFMSGGFPLLLAYFIASFIIPKEPKTFFRLDD